MHETIQKLIKIQRELTQKQMRKISEELNSFISSFEKIQLKETIN